MVGVLIWYDGGRQHYSGAKPPQDARHGQGIGGARFEAAIAIQLQKCHCGSEELRSLLRFTGAFGRGAIGAGLAMRADDEVSAVPRASLPNNDPAASKLDIIRMRAEGHN
jgi:hypothetical protein